MAFVRVSDEVNVSAGWHLEGRRLVPLLPRMLAESSYQSVAILTSSKSLEAFKAMTRADDTHGAYIALIL